MSINIKTSQVGKLLQKTKKILPYISPFFVALLQYLQLQVSSLKVSFYLLFCFFGEGFLSIFILYCIILLISATKKKWPLYLESVFITGISIANYFTFKYHGGPLLLSTMRSAKTAMNVAEGYAFRIDGYIIFLLLMLLFQTLIIRKYTFPSSLKISVCLTVIAGILTAIVLHSYPYAFSLKTQLAVEGYPISFLRDATMSRDPIKPEYYAEYDQTRGVVGNERPDIILILNESYSLLDNRNKLSDIDGTVTGKVIASKAGGGTNNSEFELLTSNSMRLLPEDAPFNYLKEQQLNKNTAVYLKSLGYETSAMHCVDPENYNRVNGYRYMGFDNIYLGENLYTKNYYGNRPWLDKDNYADMLKMCQFKDKPQFVYLLTYQNHGGYQRNDASLDTVHTKKYGKMSSEVDEYMTSVQMSEDAFSELIDKFKDSDRHTIIIMTGDHAPAFIQDIESDEMKQKQADYVMWANYDVTFEGGDLTMTDILPVVLENAKIGMSDFLATTYEAHRSYPIRTTTDELIDRTGRRIKYDGNQRIINEYYSKEYDRIT